MIKDEGINGWIEEEKVMMERMIELKREGCEGIMKYLEMEVDEKIKE